MNIDEMCSRIDAEIEALEKRIAKLREAKETILSLRGPVEEGGYHEFVETSDRSPETAKEVRSPASKTAGKSFVAAVLEKKVPVKERIQQALRDAGSPLSSAQIIERLGEGVRKQTVWAALSEMVKKRVLTKVDGDLYKLVQRAANQSSNAS